MSEQVPTPRADAAYDAAYEIPNTLPFPEMKMLDCARELERELAAANQRIAELEQDNADLGRDKFRDSQKLDEARERIAELTAAPTDDEIAVAEELIRPFVSLSFHGAEIESKPTIQDIARRLRPYLKRIEELGRENAALAHQSQAQRSGRRE
jgi:propanediol dehydratase small subunit